MARPGVEQISWNENKIIDVEYNHKNERKHRALHIIQPIEVITVPVGYQQRKSNENTPAYNMQEYFQSAFIVFKLQFHIGKYNDKIPYS